MSEQIKAIAARDVAPDLCRASVIGRVARVGAFRSSHRAVAVIAHLRISGANPTRRSGVLAWAWIGLTDRS